MPLFSSLSEELFSSVVYEFDSYLPKALARTLKIYFQCFCNPGEPIYTDVVVYEISLRIVIFDIMMQSIPLLTEYRTAIDMG